MNKEYTLNDLVTMSKEFQDQETEMITDEDMQAFRDTMESINISIDDKVNRCLHYVDRLEGQEKIFRERAKRNSDKARTVAANKERFKEYIKHCMDTLDLKEINTDDYTVKIRKAGGMQPITIKDMTKVPKEFIQTTEKVKTRDLYKYLKDTEAENETDWYKVEDRKETLRYE